MNLALVRRIFTPRSVIGDVSVDGQAGTGHEHKTR